MVFSVRKGGTYAYEKAEHKWTEPTPAQLEAQRKFLEAQTAWEAQTPEVQWWWHMYAQYLDCKSDKRCEKARGTARSLFFAAFIVAGLMLPPAWYLALILPL